MVVPDGCVSRFIPSRASRAWPGAAARATLSATSGRVDPVVRPQDNRDTKLAAGDIHDRDRSGIPRPMNAPAGDPPNQWPSGHWLGSRRPRTVVLEDDRRGASKSRRVPRPSASRSPHRHRSPAPRVTSQPADAVLQDRQVLAAIDIDPLSGPSAVSRTKPSCSDREQSPVHEPGDEDGASYEAEEVAEGPEEDELEGTHRAGRVGRAGGTDPA